VVTVKRGELTLVAIDDGDTRGRRWSTQHFDAGIDDRLDAADGETVSVV
jgi:hypothetical protein